MIIGNFRLEDDSFRGEITTLTLRRTDVVLRPTNKTGEREPDYRIVQETETGTVELGAAWKRQSGKGREFLSVVLDDPALPASVNAALFLADHDDTATLVWQRAKKAEASTALAGRNPQDRGNRRKGGPTADSIRGAVMVFRPEDRRGKRRGARRAMLRRGLYKFVIRRRPDASIASGSKWLLAFGFPLIDSGRRSQEPRFGGAFRIELGDKVRARLGCKKFQVVVGFSSNTVVMSQPI